MLNYNNDNKQWNNLVKDLKTNIYFIKNVEISLKYEEFVFKSDLRCIMVEYLKK